MLRRQSYLRFFRPKELSLRQLSFSRRLAVALQVRWSMGERSGDNKIVDVGLEEGGLGLHLMYLEELRFGWWRLA